MKTKSLYLLLVLGLLFSLFPFSVLANSTWTTVALSGGDYDSVQTALDSGADRILIEDGLYDLTENITVRQPGTVIKGASREGVVLRQTNPNKDGIQIYADNVVVSNLTIDARTHRAQSAFVAASSDHVTLEGTRILGSPNTFAVYFAGKVYPEGTATLYAFNANDLDNGNILRDNEIYSTWSGDSVSFSLQKNGIVRGNEIFGGRLAFYMNRNSQVVDNTILDSASQGIIYSLPASDNVVSENVIVRPQGSGIKIEPQIEHPIPTDYRSSNLALTNNTILDARFLGIDIANLSNSMIAGNTIRGSNYQGLLTSNSDNLLIENNTIIDSNRYTVRGSRWSWNTNTTSSVKLDQGTRLTTFRGNLIAESATYSDIGIEVAPQTNFNTLVKNTVPGVYRGGSEHLASKQISPKDSDLRVNLLVNGVSLQSEASPILDGGRVLVPFRGLLEAMDADIEWNSSTQQITAKMNSQSLTLTISSKTATVNGSQISLDTTPSIIGGRTYVPVRFISESLGAQVSWNRDLATVSIAFPNKVLP